MPRTLEAGSALEVATVLVERLPPNTSQTAKLLHRWLVAVGIETSRRKGHSPHITEAVFHLPLEQLALACGVSRISVWRHLPALRALGLVDWRAHKASCRGETRNSGTIWRVRLSPERGCKARLRFDDLKHPWRDLERDVRAGRTSYGALKHTKELQDQSLKFESLLTWTLPPKPSQNPDTHVSFSSAQTRLESVLDVGGAALRDRSAAVDRGAQALAQALRDRDGLSFYRRLLWQLLRCSDATGQDFAYQVYLSAVRARVDTTEGFARRPGALFVSRLKAAPWFEDVMRGPPTRVGSKPVSA